MKIRHFVVVGFLPILPALAATGLELDAGASYFLFRHARLEASPTPLTLDEPDRVAPFVGVKSTLTERFGLRFSYQFVNDARARAQFGYPPGNPSSPLPIIVWGHYEDDIHVLSLAPEFTWSITPHLSVTLAPQLNWVASRGLVRYSSDSALVLLVAPQERNDDGFTAGAGARIGWALGPRSSLFGSYQFVDLEPSFQRRAQILSAGVTWKF